MSTSEALLRRLIDSVARLEEITAKTAYSIAGLASRIESIESKVSRLESSISGLPRELRRALEAGVEELRRFLGEAVGEVKEAYGRVAAALEENAKLVEALQNHLKLLEYAMASIVMREYAERLYRDNTVEHLEAFTVAGKPALLAEKDETLILYVFTVAPLTEDEKSSIETLVEALRRYYGRVEFKLVTLTPGAGSIL